jgi:hypothetical protein
MGEYDDAATQEDENAIDAPKTNVDGDTKEYHDEMEIRNGMEMLKYDNEPSERFKERAEMALKGDSKMGNETKEGEWNPETGEGNGNTEEVWGSSGGKNTGEEIVKAAKASTKKRNDAEYNLTQFGDDIENSGTDKTRGKARKIAVENKTNNDKPLNETKMKRLRFKKPFDGVGNALQLIPESYRVDNKEFEMTDGNESYKIRWEGSLQEGKAVVLTASDANMVNEDIQKMKHLMSFSSKETLGTLEGQARIDESTNNPFRTMLDKTRGLMTESVEEVTETEEITEDEVDESHSAKIAKAKAAYDEHGITTEEEVNEDEVVEESENIDGQKAPVDNSVWSDADGPEGDNHGDHVMESDEVTESEEEVTESKEQAIAESIMKLMEETGMTEEEIVEGFFSGPSKEEQSGNQEALMKQAQEMAANAEAKNWKVGYLFDKKPVNTLEDLMQIAAKNKFRGKLVPRPMKKSGTFYIEYQKGLSGLQKLAGGSGQLTVGA